MFWCVIILYVSDSHLPYKVTNVAVLFCKELCFCYSAIYFAWVCKPRYLFLKQRGTPSSEESPWKAISALPHQHPRLTNNEKNKWCWDTGPTHSITMGRWDSSVGFKRKPRAVIWVLSWCWEIPALSPTRDTGHLCLVFEVKTRKKNNSDMLHVHDGVLIHVCEHVHGGHSSTSRVLP